MREVDALDAQETVITNVILLVIMHAAITVNHPVFMVLNKIISL